MLPKVPTDLSKAIREGDLRTVQGLLSRNPTYLHAPTPSVGGNWLHFAARFPDTAMVTYLPSLGLDVNSPDAEGVGPLAYAAEAGQYENVRLLLDNGTALDVTTSVANPLFAAISGSVQTNASWSEPTGKAPRIVELLLERGIDSRVRYNTRTMTNMDAVAFAMMMGAVDLARLIAAWNARDGMGDVEGMLAEGRQVAEANTRAPPPGEQYRPS